MSKNSSVAKIAISLVLGVGIGYGASYGVSHYTNDSDKVIATVNGEKIEKEDLYNRMVKSYGTDETQALIDETLIKQEAKKKNVTASDSEVTKRVEDMKTQYNGEEGLKQALTQYNLTLAGLKKELKTNILVEKILSPKIKVTEKEMKAYFDENKDSFATQEQVEASHILVADEKTAKDIKAKLDKGADFAELAKEFSTDTGTKENGGELNYFPKGQMDPAFEEAAFAAKVGTITDPVKSSYGYHIIKVTGKKEAKAANYDDSKKTIQETLFNEKMSTEYTTWLADLRKKGNIKNTMKSTSSTSSTTTSTGS